MTPCSLCIYAGLPSRPSAAAAPVSSGDSAKLRSQTGEEALRSDQGLLDREAHLPSTLRASSASKSRKADLLSLNSSLPILTNSPSPFELMRVILWVFFFSPTEFYLESQITKLVGEGSPGQGPAAASPPQTRSPQPLQAQQSDTWPRHQSSGQFGSFINSNRTMLSDLSLFLITASCEASRCRNYGVTLSVSLLCQLKYSIPSSSLTRVP